MNILDKIDNDQKQIDQLRELCKELAEALTEADVWVKGSHNMLAPLLGANTPAMDTMRKTDSAIAKYKQLIEPTKRV